ncbi:hypothetical protein JOE68_005845 [Saccharothrix algeriensis]|uniref:Uncharacterized protein n=1 Tax=Saccharothrix algeriensis TaxID=173560 RepID=A0ABS2SGB3_9PSEU|nr:hypothetical protein [Saccharothrix algeriensis]
MTPPGKHDWAAPRPYGENTRHTAALKRRRAERGLRRELKRRHAERGLLELKRRRERRGLRCELKRRRAGRG